ncbi:glycosyl transferase family 2 [Salipaludibacillus neizhouensis]|uniref:Glycosyl transferase family 2 n=1 Tax=Salipaludibacillus neizhouensis TaxID=885475 RepID=A0A3A9KK65_9BACI|nr:glycosyl transferase family 2 [Salipaludibacillus neizhouensis]RKL68185.1 glycosyl transferase family 2 [Salipaludibacillus neizhouensis]
MIDKLKKVSVDYAQLTDSIFPNYNEPIVLEVVKDSVKFEFLIRLNKESDRTIVFGSGAYDATSELKPPIFHRHKWIEHFNENLIYYNDPTLYLGQMNMGWGIGNEQSHYIEDIASILQTILSMAKLKPSKTLLYGSSAGGFMSLMLGTLLKDTTALVNNPQTIVWNYYKGHVNTAFNFSFPSLTRDEVVHSYKSRLSVIEFFNKHQYIPKIKYLQNTSSQRDLNNHLNEFILGLEKLEDSWFAGDVDILLYSDKSLNHSPLRLSESLVRIRKAVSEL